MILLMIAAALILAFANGANDNAKGVATLVGGKTLPLTSALRYAVWTTLLGSVAAAFLAGALVQKFTGAGLVGDEILASPAFAACVAGAAAATVLLATGVGMPISTTHALVGGLAGIGLSTGTLHAGMALHAFFLPLAASPITAVVLTAALYPWFRRARLRLGVTHRTCVCIEEEFHPVTVTGDGAVVLARSGLKLSEKRDAVECFQRYEGHVAGLDAQRMLDWSHLLSAGAISFARGVNDTPKIAALLIAGSALGGGRMLVAGLAIAAGGLLAARRVGETMSFKIAGMNDGQAFSANLVTAVLVIFASCWGLPVSTTHVSCGSLFGIGLVNRAAHWGMIGRIVLAWITTLPVSAGISFFLWRMLSAT